MEIYRIGKSTKKDLEKYLKQRIMPVKFCYSEKGGDKWHELRQDKLYELGKRELKAFIDGLTKVSKIVGKLPINLVHLGPGDGIEIPILFDKFKPNSNRRYAGVDVSEQMIYNTLRLNKTYFSGADPLWYLTDIETHGNLELVCEDVRKRGANRNLIVSNGGSLLSNYDVFKYLKNSMKKEDYLFLTLEGDDLNKREEICSTYKLPETQNLLAVGLKRAGYTAEDGSFRTCFNKVKSRIEVYFKPKDEREILCLTSYKPREDGLRRRLIDSGFDIQYLKFYENVHAFAVLCKKGEKNV